MKDNVRIKSFSKGLIIRFNEEASFDDILAETAAKFRDGKSFFGNAAVAVMLQGKELSETQESQLIDAIESECELKVICLITGDEEKEKFFIKAVQFAERQKMADTALGEEIQVFRGDLTEGEQLDTPSSIILLGDVGSGCSISSEKNIMILGALYGEAHAGVSSKQKDHFVAAMEMMPEALTVGDFKYIPPKKAIWSKKKKEQMLVASVQGKKIEIQEFTKEYLGRF